MLRLGWSLAICFILITAILVATTNRLRNQLERARREVAALTHDFQEERGWAGVVSSPGARTASFVLTPAGDPTLRARATIDPSSRRALLVFENFKKQDGHDYELWALRGNTPFALGLVRGDESGHAVLRIADVGDPSGLTAFAISLEQEGGAAADPIGPIVMIGSLGG